MKIRAGYTITYGCLAPTPMLLLLNVHPDRRGDLITQDTVHTDPLVEMTQYVDGFGNLVSRIVAPPGQITLSSDFLIEDTGRPDAQAPSAKEIPVQELPPEILPFVLGSRYCETDRLATIAWDKFGKIKPGWGRVQAIVDYAHRRIEFGYHHARPTKTAHEAHEEQKGVCRDYAHLSIALLRAMNIPARYCTGYLGDIGVPPVDAPMDFSAWIEVYLDGRWFTFDARHNRPRIGRIVMARGRDATDVAISTAFGTADLLKFQVVTDEQLDGGGRAEHSLAAE
jgi:transglutaminase-like putative cysteine protease